ncbi:hypothetical protein J6590_052044 [Homalodisca vitripennis]|nr:hypothetical protein J6590_052044 [Homalodisca vitripennis]
MLVITVVKSSRLRWWVVQASYTPACSRNDPKLNECVVRHGQQAIPQFINGDPKYRVPQLDPLTINQLSIRQGTNQVGINLQVRDCKIYGLRHAQFIAARTDLKKRHIEWDFKIPSVQIRGFYNISGKVLILPISGSGKANITINDLSITYKYDWELVKKGNGKHYMNFTNSELLFDNGRAFFQLDNLFNGDKLLGDNMNYFLNENWKEVTRELGPALGEAIGEVFRLLLTNIADLVPYEYIYPDIPATPE